MIGKIDGPAAWPPPRPSVMKCGVTKCSPFQEGFPAQGQTGMLRGEQVTSSQGEQGAPGSSSAVASAAFSREERGHRASPEHHPSSGCSGGCRTCQDLPGPASLFGLCVAECGSRLINRFQTLPSAEASVSGFLLPTPPPSCNSSLTTWAWPQSRPRACKKENQGNLVLA